MFGAGTLLRIMGRNAARVLDRLGLLPSRYYLRDALDALSEDDLPRLIRALHRARGGQSSTPERGKTSVEGVKPAPIPTWRWELIRQQAVFRCRILNETHRKSLQRLERLQQAGCLERTPQRELRETIELHRTAIRVLSRYEASLQGLALPYMTQVNQAWLE